MTSPNQQRHDKATKAIYHRAPPGALAKGYPWSKCYERATLQERFAYRLSCHSVYSDSRDLSIMRALHSTARDWPERMRQLATVGMTAAEYRATFYGEC